MRFGLFARKDRRSPAERDAADRVRAIVVGRLGLPDGSTVTVSEIDCADPACPGTETVILVCQPRGRTVAYKVGRPLCEVTEQDLHEALVGPDNG